MEKIKRYIKGVIAVFAAVFFFGNSVMSISATEISEDIMMPRIVLEKYEVTNEKIVPGEDFTLTLTLANYNTKDTAKDVLIDIMNPDGVAPVYGTISQVYVGDIAPGETKEVQVDYNSWTSIVGDTLDFNVTIVTSANTNYITLRIPSGSDSPFSILSTNVPEVVAVDEVISMSVAFQVLGEENIKDVALNVYESGELIAASQIGIMTPGVTKTQQVSTFLTETGDCALEIALEYIDNVGQQVVVPVRTAIISVVEESELDYEQDYVGSTNVDEPAEESNTMLLLGVGGILIVGIFLVAVIVARKNR